ncbi:protein of unknown function [Denitratisoma oestradiolicum]|uniref:Uncharacterized protein n=1 Tax=Denitratisoma oestradiolicum TaxID=311182 RepID=A0A6S6XZX5_9PROT|nr:protein of unknown function [Denitratisoma oestradiolicum]
MGFVFNRTVEGWLIKSMTVAGDAAHESDAIVFEYLYALVEKIVVNDQEAMATGVYSRLASAMLEKKKGTSVEVPSSMPDWRARRDSNARPLPSEGSTLSS